MPRITHFKAHLPAYLVLLFLPLLLASSCDNNEVECETIPYCQELDDYLPYEVGTLLAYRNLNTGDTVYFGCTSIVRDWWTEQDDQFEMCREVEYDRYSFNSSDPDIGFTVFSVYPRTGSIGINFRNNNFDFNLNSFCRLSISPFQEQLDTALFYGEPLFDVYVS